MLSLDVVVVDIDFDIITTVGGLVDWIGSCSFGTDFVHHRVQVEVHVDHVVVHVQGVRVDLYWVEGGTGQGEQPYVRIKLLVQKI